ncbi:MAG TPA: hypothetical protein PKD51_10965 [Saprospiraceae bacterium]|nr:hypothetical protein [Saprospiraceae bacterium]
MFDVVYVISHGFSSRMVTQTNLLVNIVEKGYRVGIITNGHDSDLKKYCDDNDIQIIEIEQTLSFIQRQFLDIKRYILDDLDTNIALMEKHVWAIKYSNFGLITRLKYRLAYQIYKILKLFPSIRNLVKSKINILYYDRKSEELLKRINTRILVSTYPINFLETSLLLAANKLKILNFIHFLSWDNITSKGYIPAVADKFISWGEVMEKEIIEYYNISKKNIYNCGVVHFDLHHAYKNTNDYKLVIQDLGLDPLKPYIYYGMVAARFVPNEINLVRWLSEQISNNRYGNEIQLVIRPHPQNVSGYMKSDEYLGLLKGLTNSRVAIHWPAVNESTLQWSMKNYDMHNISKLLNGCMFCINAGSTLAVDALNCNKLTIVTGFDLPKCIDYWKSAARSLDFTHLKNFLKNDGVILCTSLNQFDEVILNIISNKYSINLDSIIKLKNMYCTSNEGNSTEMVVGVLVDHLNMLD